MFTFTETIKSFFYMEGVVDENFEKEEKDIYHYHHQKENINSIGGRWADSFGMPNILCGDGSELPYWETRVFF